jgi:SAM-dependent methyltransferase
MMIPPSSDVSQVLPSMRSEVDTQPRTSSLLEAVCEELASAGERLCRMLPRVRDLGGVESCFATLLGSQAVRKARMLSGEPEQVRRAQEALRHGLRGLYAHARSWEHSLNKPYGYPGDFSVLELVYGRAAHRDTREPWARLVDVWGTQTQLPRAVCARKDVLRSWLESYLGERYMATAPARILSVASGAARELRELSTEALARGQFTLVDADERALLYARGALQSLPTAPELYTLVGDAVRGRGLAPLAEQAPYDLVYCFGLFDYLPDALLVRSARHFTRLLAEDGTFIFCLKDERHYDAWFYQWLYDWCFVPRVREDGLRLAARLGLRVKELLTVEGGAVSIFVCQQD